MITRRYKKGLARFQIELEAELCDKIKSHCADNEVLLKDWLLEALVDKYKKDMLEDR